MTTGLELRLRKIFYWLNRYFMVPMFRLGLGPLMGTPFGGYIMVLKVVGRKTGKVRYAPVNYAIIDGDVYCIAGFGTISDWYRNLLAHPHIEAILPGGAIAGIAERVDDEAVRLPIIRQILINGGFAGFFYGFDPRTVSAERLAGAAQNAPLIRIRPTGIGAGASDPGGWAWVWSIVLTALFFIAFGRRKQNGN